MSHCGDMAIRNYPLGFDVTGNSAILSADPENRTLEPNMKCFGSPVVEIWPLVIPCTTVSLYGSETSALTRALQDKVDAFDNMSLRRILRISYMDHITNAMVKLHAGSPPQLSQLIQARRLRFFLYTWQGWIRNLTSRPEHSVFTRGLPKDWRRPPGRPRTTEVDLQPLNFGLNSAWKYTQDRED